jgi:hypothetical protein
VSPTETYRLRWVGVILLTVPGLLLAKQQAPSDQSKRTVELRSQTKLLTTTDLELAPEVIAAMELGLDFRAIKDRPFRAEMVLETDRRLADGNSLHRKSTAMFYRDQNGRWRQERGVEHHGKQDQQTLMETIISITDPEKGVHYSIFPRVKVGFRMQEPLAFLKEMESRRTTPWTPQRDQNFTSQILGNQMIEGLQCEGRIDTVTIPTGSTGNSFPIEIVTERWYSADLQINLVVKHTDPRSGETTIRLTNVSLEEPQKALFEIPPGYEIREGGTTTIPLAEKKKP